MRLSASVRVERPRDAVWAALVDFPHYEARLTERVPDLARVGPAPDWRATVTIKGVTWPGLFRVAEFEPRRRLVLTGEIGALEVVAEFDLDDAEGGLTNLSASLSFRANGLRAKALLKSLTLTRGAFQERFADRLGWLARDIERRAG